MKEDTKQYYRAIFGTITLLCLTSLGVGLIWNATGFLKLWGYLLIIIVYSLMLYINYNFIKWHDAKIEEEVKV